MFQTLLFLCLSYIIVAQELFSCEAPVVLGDNSCKDPKPGKKYFYDPKHIECYEFTYVGCNKGTNHYDTEAECLRCRPMDIQICGGNAEATGTCGNQVIEIGKKPKPQCPEGSECHSGHPIGLCCDKTKYEEWKKERNPVCEHGELVTKKEWFGTVTRFGRKCAHKFCPKKTDCFEGKYLAYCCDKNAKKEDATTTKKP